MEGKTIYVVTAGDYSDYGICGVYSTKAKAKRARELFTDQWGRARIEEYELDKDHGIPDGMLPWTVRMLKDGEVMECDRASVDDTMRHWVPYGDDETVCFDMLAKDQTHAVKIANERRAGLIASGLWTTDVDEWRERNKEPQS